LGPDIVDPRQNAEIKRYTAQKMAEQQQVAVEATAEVSAGNGQS
jgi:hypothetical protein